MGIEYLGTTILDTEGITKIRPVSGAIVNNITKDSSMNVPPFGTVPVPVGTHSYSVRYGQDRQHEHRTTLPSPHGLRRRIIFKNYYE